MKLFNINSYDLEDRQHWIIEKIHPPKVVNGIIQMNEPEQNERGKVISSATPIELETEVKVGDVVMFPNGAGNGITWNKRELIIMNEREILGIIN